MVFALSEETYIEVLNLKQSFMKKRINISVFGLLIAMLTIVLSSCVRTDYAEREEETIQDYLQRNNITEDPKESGLYYVELVAGTGMQPVVGDTVEVFYTGRFLNGQIFDSNMDSDAFKFALGKGYVIQGWDEGVAYMREGGEALFLIPSSLAYGSAGTWSIPGYTPLAFEVILDNVIPGLGRK